MNLIKIIEAKYIDNFKVEISFDDNTRKIVDFYVFVHSSPIYKKYSLEKNFKNFKIENNNLVWGSDWDMIFPLEQLYNGNIN
jgi:hypothetical protein